MMEIGLGVQTDKTMAEYEALALAAESYGIDTISVYNDIPYGPPVPALLAMARVTNSIRLGPASLNPATMAPHEIAGHMAALDLASSGRAFLGLVRGAWLESMGIDTPGVNDMADAVEVITRLWAGDDSGYQGSRFGIAPGTRAAYPVLRERMPIMIGSWGPRLAEVASRVADEVKVGGSASSSMAVWMQDQTDVSVVLGAVSVVDEDRRKARALARREVAPYLDVVAELDPTFDVDPEALGALRAAMSIGDLERAASSVSDELLDLFAFAGSPDDVAQQVAALAQVGVHRVELGTPHGITSLSGVELIGKSVVPAVREALA